MNSFKKLQNGSDIRGVALAVPGGSTVSLDRETVMAIGFAFVRYLIERGARQAALRIAVGRDSRLTGSELAGWIMQGIAAAGASAFDGGMASTPAMFMSCVNELAFDAAIMVTASHLPMERNGMKFFTPQGGLEKSDISRILELAGEGITPSGSKGECGNVDIMTPYIDGLKDKIVSQLGDSAPLSGLHIVVDAGSGAGGFFAERLLAPLGADISGSLYLEPDGRFPFHQPNPENPEAMRCICEAVMRNNADFGIIFDTDVDRAGAVLPDGRGNVVPLDRNALIAMMSAVLKKQYGAITVVTDSITSDGLTAFIEGLDCKHHRFKRGYRNVINEAKRLIAEGERALLAMETSGHGALEENYFLDDGAYIIVKLLIELVAARREGMELGALIAGLREPAQSCEIRLKVLLDDTLEYTGAVLDFVSEYFSSRDGFELAPNNYEGVRINADGLHGDGWFLIRRSLHDPIMPCNFESNTPGGADMMRIALYECIARFDKLDAERLKP